VEYHRRARDRRRRKPHSLVLQSQGRESDVCPFPISDHISPTETCSSRHAGARNPLRWRCGYLPAARASHPGICTTHTCLDWMLMNYSIWRSTLILSFASCYIMWGKSIDGLPPPLFPIPLHSPPIARRDIWSLLSCLGTLKIFGDRARMPGGWALECPAVAWQQVFCWEDGWRGEIISDAFCSSDSNHIPRTMAPPYCPEAE
jgi:hypothetical protein